MNRALADAFRRAGIQTTSRVKTCDHVTCNYCGQPAKLVKGDAIYPNREDLHDLNFWRCTPCNAHVGCHRPGANGGDGTVPLGRLANAELRMWKSKAHAAIDPKWQEDGRPRQEVYARMAAVLNIPKEDCHIGGFDVAMCKRVVDLANHI